MSEFNHNKNDDQNELLLYKSFPTNCLPNLASRFVRDGSAAIGCDESLVALPLLAAISACIGSAARLRAKNRWIVPSILWCCVSVKSGSAKTPAQRLSTDILKELQDVGRSEYKKRFAEYSIQRDRAKKKKSKTAEPMPLQIDEPVEKRVLTTNVTVEGLAKQLETNPGMLVDSDELASWIGSLSKYNAGSSDLNDWLSIYSGASFTHDRKDKSNSLYVRFPSVSICGGIQPERLHTIFNGEHFDSGLTARFLFAQPPTSKRKFSSKDLSEKLRNEMKLKFQSLFELDPIDWGNGDDWKPRMVSLSRGALSEYETFYNNHGEETIAASGAENAALSKLEELPLRLSLIFSLFEDHDARMVSEVTMNSAIRLTKWFIREAKRLYGTRSPDQELQSLIVESIQCTGESSVRDLQRRRLQKFNSSDIEKQIGRLVSMGVLVVNDLETGGRPTRVYKLTNSQICDCGYAMISNDTHDGYQNWECPNCDLIRPVKKSA